MDRASLHALVRALLPDAVEAVPQGVTGAYVLLISLAAPVHFKRAALGAHILSGDLLYIGSACGSGGIAARVARHVKRDKSVRWHVDELTNAAQLVSALSIVDGDECAIVARLLGSGRFTPALRGFGSSDCRVCAAHLLEPVE